MRSCFLRYDAVIFSKHRSKIGRARKNVSSAGKGFFDPNSHTISYVVFDQDSKQSAVIIPFLILIMRQGQLAMNGRADLAYIQKLDLDVVWHIETHVHADHLSAAPYLQDKVGGQLMISEKLQRYRKFLARFSMLALSLSVMAVNLIDFWMIMTAINLGTFWTGYSHAGSHSSLYGPHNWGCSFCWGYIIYA